MTIKLKIDKEDKAKLDEIRLALDAMQKSYPKLKRSIAIFMAATKSQQNIDGLSAQFEATVRELATILNRVRKIR